MISVLKPGLLDLVMDLGRPGFRAQGVPAGGAADMRAMVAANRLVGNADNACVLEMLLRGPRLMFEEAALVGVAGAEMPVSVNGVVVSAAGQIRLLAGDVLEIGAAHPVTKTGARAYLAFRGGLDVRSVMGSGATFLPGGFGGFQGRALRVGDGLVVGNLPVSVQETLAAMATVGNIRLLPGPQIADFSDIALTALSTRRYRVGADANRVGIRLLGVGLSYQGKELPSQAVLPGAMQVPPDGQPILLGWDGPVTGGYPVIAGVVSADLPRLAQLKPGDTVGFEFVTREQLWRE